MSNGFVKLDDGMLDSSLWAFRDDRSLFITALLMARPIVLDRDMPQLQVRSLDPTGWVVPPGRYGLIGAAGVGIIRRDGIAEEEGYLGLERLSSPDPESRSQDFDGRRLARIDGGYIVLNYMRFRDKDYTVAERAKAYRDRKRDARDAGVTQSDGGVPSMLSASASEVEVGVGVQGEGDARLDYCIRLAVAANKGLDQPMPRILPTSGSTYQVADILMAADIPIAFAEQVVFERASASPSKDDIRALSYFTRAVVEAWQRKDMGEKVKASGLRRRTAEPERAAVPEATCPECGDVLIAIAWSSHFLLRHPDLYHANTVPTFAPLPRRSGP